MHVVILEALGRAELLGAQFAGVGALLQVAAQPQRRGRRRHGRPAPPAPAAQRPRDVGGGHGRGERRVAGRTRHGGRGEARAGQPLHVPLQHCKTKLLIVKMQNLKSHVLLTTSMSELLK